MTSGWVRIAADTAWVFVYNPDSILASRVQTASEITIGHAAKLRAVRVERSAGKWVGVRVDPRVVP